ncbi:MAG: class I SAM-dependent methyltransferase [Deltaproteobacteria bacterium]|nr:class I SAM-dependent methyltransferase [Deltaproteobacteria bacterium]
MQHLARFAFVTLTALLAAPSFASTEDAIRAALADPARKEADRARDAQRHPLETLTFFGLKPDMHVLELWPGGGWYTEVLGPVLREKGKLSVTNADPNGPQDKYAHKLARGYADHLAANEARLGKVSAHIVAPPDQLSFGEADSVDMIVTFRNNHSWLNGGYQDAVYREALRVLKPGGVLGVVQHRAAEGADPAVAMKTGYLPEAAVIAPAEAAGFVLDAKSEINANPRDTKDYPKGVWTLPPNFAEGDTDRAKYEAIGESDRMTLRFVKPKAAK